MKGNPSQWEKLGRILRPDRAIGWMITHTGASFAVPVGSAPVFDLYVTGRNASNQSQIGRMTLTIRGQPYISEINKQPVLSCGSLGAFDENGVSYPCLVRHRDNLYLYYTGWMPTVLTPFQNHLGLAVQQKTNRFARVSRAPIMDRTDKDHLSIGSVFVMRDNDMYRMWYTSFIEWVNTPEAPKHRYIIKHALSEDGVNWIRRDEVCIDTKNDYEHSICRPSVYRYGNLYHMWYCYRGDHYKIGYAYSTDGIAWTRADKTGGLPMSPSGWDSESQSYPHVFRCGDHLYMLYCGNNYGKDGLGLARLRLPD